MIITWLGQNCFKIESKQACLVIDPVEGPSAKMPKISADILILPRPVDDTNLSFLKSPAFVIKTPGEFESKGVFVEGQTFNGKEHLIFRFEMEGISFGHLGVSKKMDEGAVNFLEGVDVLFVPVGGGAVLNPDAAANVVSDIEPRLVIPMYFRESSAPKLEPVEKFCQAMGVKKPERVKKLNLAKKDLPNEETRLIIIEE